MDVVLCKYSFNLCTHKKDLYAAMWKDSKTAQGFSCGKTKSMDIIKFGLAPYFRSLLLENLKESPCHSISFDESYNKITKSGQKRKAKAEDMLY